MKKLKGIILGVLLAASVLMPFNVYADDYTNSTIVGHNVTLEEVMKYTNGGSVFTDYIYKAHFVLDNNYIGQITITFNYSASSQGNQSFTRLVNVNGDSFDITFYIHDDGGYSTGERPALNSTWYSVQSHNLELKFTNDWQFPIESYSIVQQALDNNLEIIDFYKSSNYIFPIFDLNNGDTVLYDYMSTPNSSSSNKVFIFCTSAQYAITDDSSFKQNFGFYDYNSGTETTDTYIVQSAETLFRWMVRPGSQYRIYKVEFQKVLSGYDDVVIKSKRDTSYIPIYYNYKRNKNISLDFALNFGLSNSLMEDIHTIAEGTSGSQSSASDLEDNNDQMADDMNDLATIENGYNQDFNNQLQNIDFSNPIQNNQGILSAANFVISVFNGLISNNPFSLLIIVCCILLIGKKVIGK